MAIRNIPLGRFLREVSDRHTLQRAKPFCFVLGAGASFESEIPTGATLVDRWIADMHRDDGATDITAEKWATAKKLGIKSFVYERRAEHYGKIYARRFDGTHDTGHAELQSLLSGKEPSFGYSILAYLLANTQHKAVITTNFDNLVADALYLYSNTAPILCVHESLAGFVTAQLDRPLVVKIHRDLLLSPRNADDEIDALDRAWDMPLRTLLSHFTPIFIGYGGNDGSLMGFLEKLEPPIPDRIYWCVRSGAPPNDRVIKLLDKRDGVLVTIPGFDQLMLLLKQALGIPDLLPILEERHKQRAERYNKKFTELCKVTVEKSRAPEATAEEHAIAAAAIEAVKQAPVEDTPSSHILHAQAEPDADQAEACLRSALKKFPGNGDLMAALGELLADKKQQFDAAEDLIRTAYEQDAKNPFRQRDYGIFLYYCRGDGKRAEPLLQQAVATFTATKGADDLDTLKSRNNLANALGTQGRYAEEEREHRAVQACRERVLGADHRDTLASRSNLAAALRGQGKHAEAEREHRAVLAIQERVLGTEHPDILASRNNLANALYKQGRYAEAEREYRAVLAIQERVLGAEHPDMLVGRSNLAMVLRSQAKHAEAEPEHRAVLAIQERVLGADHPNVSNGCYNLALCLEDQGKLSEALEFSRRAHEGWKKVLGEEHPDTEDARNMWKRIEKEAEKEGGGE